MPIPCPACQGRSPRLAGARGVRDKIARIFGVYWLRCTDCGHRFRDDLWDFRRWLYARCPRCYRLELSSWSEKHYQATTWMQCEIALGAHRYRCDACRHNFASFLPPYTREGSRASNPVRRIAAD